ncbi:hypothetical protein [Lachnoanaerobaculum orale]|uniref:hypothetical protein n=1 Tax=Lachnoanaerobaculum orale TaxID=979627 RepID=UPI0023A8D9CF|nr:hypothetical protein [Lachnoanaerobaculum orale]
MNYFELMHLIDDFQRTSKPSNPDSSSPCTKDDISKVVDNISNLLRTLINELHTD